MIYWSHFPERLTQRPQWCCHRAKRPYQVDGRPARSNDPSTWTTYAAVQAACAADPTLGPEYMLSPDDGIVVLDCDHVRDPICRMVDTWAWELALMCETYTEVSVSRTGLHIVGEAEATSRQAGPLQMFARTHAITFTGNTLSGFTHRINNIQAVVDLLTAFHFAPPAASAPPAAWRPTLDTGSVLRRALLARNGTKFRRLYEGDSSGYPSQSEADFALCVMLAFWTRDPAQLDGIFRTSGRFPARAHLWDTRHTSDGRTYGALTIGRAIEATPTGYGARDEAPTWRGVEVTSRGH